MAANVKYTLGPDRPNKPHQWLVDQQAAAVEAVYGPGYTWQIYSGRGPHGSRRHRRNDNEGAADGYVIDPRGRRLQGEELLPLGEYWISNGFGSAGMVMRNGGIHLDSYQKGDLVGDEALFWGYGKQGGTYTGEMRRRLAAAANNAPGAPSETPVMTAASDPRVMTLIGSGPHVGVPAPRPSSPHEMVAPTPRPMPSPEMGMAGIQRDPIRPSQFIMPFGRLPERRPSSPHEMTTPVPMTNPGQSTPPGVMHGPADMSAIGGPVANPTPRPVPMLGDGERIDRAFAAPEQDMPSPFAPVPQPMASASPTPNDNDLTRYRILAATRRRMSRGLQ